MKHFKVTPHRKDALLTKDCLQSVVVVVGGWVCVCTCVRAIVCVCVCARVCL